ncbi:LacI family transcriptional regulator [Jiangella asiatica]|uniref:LacI family transcriptional regulator n=1 Tax=Jiangella asiatica TaxID=2530372 RepID=A0A4R5D5X6_9ACTN|nr:LacI family transcriptional regulator [Jiangella asiatica]
MANGSSRATTLTDVARLAGVSVATASKALNGRAGVRTETRERVVDVAKRLAFQPNALAKSLLAGRTGTVGLLTSDMEGRFSLPIMMGVEDAFGAARTSVFLCDARGDSIREQHHVDALLSRRVDGLIVVGSRTEPRPSLGRGLPVPVVYVYSPSDHPDDMSLVIDNVAGASLAIQHLVTGGRKRIAHIAGDPGYQATHDRARGAEAALDAAGLSLACGRIHYGSWTEAWGRGATRMLLADEPAVDAIFCGSDQIARGCLEVLRDQGREIPDDVAVIGFDNWEVLTVNARPELTSVDMRLEELGRRAAQRLYEAIDERMTPGVEMLHCQIVQRGSTIPLN